MFKQLLHRSILLAFLWVPLGASADDEFGSIVIFGDSLSDNGNLAALSDLPQFAFLAFLKFPPFDFGFSNGPRAVEVLADELELPAKPALYLTSPAPMGTNFAVAGARAVNLDPFFPIDLPNQIGVFLLSQGGAAPSDALYVVFIGGNDIRDARGPDEFGMLPDDAAAATIIAQAAGGVEAALQSLAEAGAQTIMVVNAPDIGGIPETALLAALFGGEAFIQRATNLTRAYNEEIEEAARRTERDYDVNIIRFDTFSFFNEIQGDGEEFGFTNVSDACFSTNTLLTTGDYKFDPECNGGLNFDSFVFFDEIHPTAAVHELAGEALEDALDDFEEGDDDDNDDDDDD